MNRRLTLNRIRAALELVSLACSTYVAVTQVRALLSEDAEDASGHVDERSVMLDDGDSYTYVPDGRYTVAKATVTCFTCSDVDNVLQFDGDPVDLAEFNGSIVDHEIKWHSTEDTLA
jgi:hypothetical protein